MKKIVKKVIVYSMVGLLQAGLFATVTEAAAKPNDPQPGYNQQQDPKKNNDPKKDNNKNQQDKDRKIEAEKQRHENEMKRKPNESDRDWQKRQQQEKERHEKNLKGIQGKK